MRAMAKRLPILVLIAAAATARITTSTFRPNALVLTGIVTTHDVAVAPQIGGRLVVAEGEGRRRGHQGPGCSRKSSRASCRPTAPFTSTAPKGIASQVRESEAALRLQERQLIDQVKQAEAAVATAEAQRNAAAADVERAKVTLDRTRELFKQQLAPAQAMDEARTAYEAALARMDSLARQVDSARSRG